MTTPIAVNGIPNTIAIAAGTFHSVALKSDGTVWTWGTNYYGSLGNGTTTDSYTPTQVISLSGVVAVAAGYYHTLALTSDGTVWAWGANDSGELGNPSIPIHVGFTIGFSTVPVPVSGLTGIVAIAAGRNFSLAVASDGTVWGWGDNSYGQVGTALGGSTPSQVSGLTGAVAVAAGSFHSLALKSDGTVWGWGDNGFGQVGTAPGGSTPGQVSGLSGVTALAAGYRHSLALKADGTVWAWGDNGYSELGNGTSGGTSTTPVQVSGLISVTAIAAGSADSVHSLALSADGTAWAWGYNVEGELGNGTTNSTTVPVHVSGLTNVEAVAGASLHSLALVGNPHTALALSAPSSSVAQSVAVTGTSFAAGEPVKLYWDSTTTTPLTTTTATANSALLTHVSVPPTTAGGHNILAVGQTSGKTAFSPIRVKPRLFLLPWAGTPGTKAVAFGLGFGTQERVKLYWDKPAQPLGVATSNSGGGFYGSTAVTITVPLSATTGWHVVYGVGQTTRAVGVGLFYRH